VADGDRLLVLLGRVQRRIAAQTALQGALAGSLIALLALDLCLLLLRSSGGVPAGSWLAAVLAGGGLGAIVAVLRRPCSRGAAARRVDAATGKVKDDLVFLALHLRERAGSAFAQAAVRVGLQRMLETRLAQVAPWRRPRGLGALVGLGAVTAGLLLWPGPSSAGDQRSAEQSRATAAEAQALAAVRAELERLQRTAGQMGDPELLALAAEADRLLRGPPRPEQWHQLAQAAEAARAAAQGSAALATALAQVGEILAAVPQARSWGQALSQMEGRASEREARAAAEKVGQANQRERQALAEALAQAAEALRALQEEQKQKAAEQEAENERKRRLSGLSQQKPASAAQSEQQPSVSREQTERNLRRLERELQDSADACRRDPEACARSLGQAADSLGSEMARARSASERNELARALEEELSRQGQGQGGQGQGQRQGQEGRGRAVAEARASSAGGATRSLSAPAPGSGQGEEAAGGSREGGTGPESGSGAGVEAAQELAAGAGSAPGSGEGIGSGTGETGGEPATGSGAGRGEKREVPLPAGPGPSRAEVIEGSGRGGFSQPSYRRVYREYEAAIEESLDVSAVPPGRRRLVRRYFDLIRPR
jgi:hypothetical protein